MKACPQCKSVSRLRMKRKVFLKLFPGTKSYSCDKCNATYTWFPLINASFKS